MSIEDVARDFIVHMDDAKRTLSKVTPDAKISGGVLPMPLPASETINTLSALKTAFPDLRYDIQKITVNGNQATVNAKWSGTNTGSLSLPSLPGAPSIPSVPATGRKISVDDTYIVTVDGDKVSHMEVRSPSGGGIPGALAQLGVKVPGM